MYWDIRSVKSRARDILFASLPSMIGVLLLFNVLAIAPMTLTQFLPFPEWVQLVIQLLFAVFVGGPLTVGLSCFLFYNSHPKSGVHFTALFSGFFRERYLPSMLGMTLFMLLSQSLSFYYSIVNRSRIHLNLLSVENSNQYYANIFCGFFIILAICFIQYLFFAVPYILAENPNIGVFRAISLGLRMTSHERWKLLQLDLSFIGWYILGIIVTVIASLIFLFSVPLVGYIILLVGILTTTFLVNSYQHAAYAEVYNALRVKAVQANLCCEGEIGTEIFRARREAELREN